MRTSKLIRVRPLEVSDFRFIRRLAVRQRNFTVPPFYVLWLLKETNGQCCLVAQHAKLGPVAYLLSILVTTRRGRVLYVWQLAASKKGLEIGATEMLLLTLRAFMRRTRVQRVFFTADPESAQFRAIRKYAYALFGAGLRHRRVLPASVSPNESEFVVRVM